MASKFAKFQGLKNNMNKDLPKQYLEKMIVREHVQKTKNLHPNVKQKWRVRKYGEQKGSFFTDKILGDDGKPDLQGVIDRTKASVRSGVPTQEEIEAQEAMKGQDGAGPSSEDEEMTKKGTSTRDKRERKTSQNVSQVPTETNVTQFRDDHSK